MEGLCLYEEQWRGSSAEFGHKSQRRRFGRWFGGSGDIGQCLRYMAALTDHAALSLCNLTSAWLLAEKWVAVWWIEDIIVPYYEYGIQGRSWGLGKSCK